MLKIDVNQIKESVEELDYSIEKYEEYSMSIMQEVRNIEFSWHDDHSTSFFEKITVHRQEIMRFISDLNKTKESYNNISNEINKVISPIKNIYFNPAYKDIILNNYKNNINNLKNIKQRINNLYTSFCSYGERLSISRVALNLDTTIKKLENSKNNVDKMFTNLNSLEQRIGNILQKLQIDKISLFDNSEYI